MDVREVSRLLKAFCDLMFSSFVAGKSHVPLVTVIEHQSPHKLIKLAQCSYKAMRLIIEIDRQGDRQRERRENQASLLVEAGGCNGQMR